MTRDDLARRIVEHAVCVIDREQGGRELLDKVGCSLAAVFTRTELEKLVPEDRT